MKTFCLRIFFLISSIMALSFTQQPIAWISWNKNTKLTWDDFKAVPDYTSINTAISNIQLNWPEKKTKDSVTFTVKSLFSPELSWVKRDQIKNTEWDTLGIIHENKHFDIGELYARKLRKVFSETSFTNDELLNGKSDKIADSLKNEMVLMQTLYDKETSHAMNKKKQLEWNFRIEKELLAWEKYKYEKVTVFLKK